MKNLILVILISLILRFLLLGIIPVGFSSDEASLGYNAYSILKTGKDEHGVFLPLAFQAFGEYKAPLYIYLTVPFIKLFGFNEFATRFPSAFFGILTIVFLYFLVKEISQDRKLAFLSALVLAISPWHLQFTRIAYEGSVTLFLLVMLTLFFVKSFSRGFYLIISAISVGLVFYSHYSVRLFFLFYLLALLLFLRKELKLVKIKYLFASIFLGFLVLLPLLPYLFSRAGTFRASYISFFTDQGVIFAINEKVAEHNWSSFQINLPARLIHNKIIDYQKTFLANYISHFDFSFLFLKGDEDILFRTPFTGLLLISFLPFLLVGFYQLFKKNKLTKVIVLNWLICAPLASSLTRLSTSANRAFMMIVPLSIIIAIGLLNSFAFLKRKFFFLVLFIFFFLIEYLLYLDSYYIHLEIKNINDNRLAKKEVIKRLTKLINNYNEIWIDKRINYIHLLFYLSYPPDLYQKQEKVTAINEFGFIDVYNFDKYRFAPIPKYFDFTKNILYVASSSQDIIPLDKTLYPDGRDFYLFFDTNSVKNQCRLCDINLKPVDLDIYGNKIEKK